MGPLTENERQPHQNPRKPFEVQLRRGVLRSLGFAAVQKHVLPLHFSLVDGGPCFKVVHIVDLLREIGPEHVVALFSLETPQDGVGDVHHEEGFDVAVPIVVGSEHPFVALIDNVPREVEEFFVDGVTEVVLGDDGKVAFLIWLLLLQEDGGPGLIDAFDVFLPGKVLIKSEVAQRGIAQEFYQAFPGEDDVFEDEKGKRVAHQFFSFEVLDNHRKVVVPQHCLCNPAQEQQILREHEHQRPIITHLHPSLLLLGPLGNMPSLQQHNNNYDQKPTCILFPYSHSCLFAGCALRIQSNITITMSIFKLFKKKEHGGEVQEKLNVSTVFNREEEVKKSQNNKNLQYNSSKQRHQHFEVILKASIVDLEKLKQLSWNGIPQTLRTSAWKLLLKYMPTNQDNQLQTLQRKRKEYFVMVNTYIENPSLEQDAQEKKIFKLINDDVLRTLPESNLFRNERIQKIMRRLLYVWHMRHPASGYVQGINDVATPFIVVFLSEYIEVNLDTLDGPAKLEEVTDQQLANVEGDSYYCLSKILDGILDNYTSSWPGIQKSFIRIEEVIKRVDPDLLAHFSAQSIDFYHMYFKWVTCLLLRQFSMKICLRLFDTYLAIQNNYFGFCLYILAAIILKYSKKFKKMGFEEMMIFQQNMPTKEWTEQDLATVIAEAYVYQSYFVK